MPSMLLLELSKYSMEKILGTTAIKVSDKGNETW